MSFCFKTPVSNINELRPETSLYFVKKSMQLKKKIVYLDSRCILSHDIYEEYFMRSSKHQMLRRIHAINSGKQTFRLWNIEETMIINL